jgi:phage shock protein C
MQLFRVTCVNTNETGSVLTKGETMATDKKTLRRSRRNRVFFGVCGGLGDFFGVNPNWFRLGFLIALIPGGVPGILIYLLMWIIIPSE